MANKLIQPVLFEAYTTYAVFIL